MRSPLRRAYEANDWPQLTEIIKADCILNAGGCWIWQRASKDGYASVRIGARNLSVHRLILQAKYDGSDLGSQAAHHTCAVTMCANPDHLQPVTHRENLAEMLARQSYLARIRELEAALGEVAPNHQLLSFIQVI